MWQLAGCRPIHVNRAQVLAAKATEAKVSKLSRNRRSPQQPAPAWLNPSVPLAVRLLLRLPHKQFDKIHNNQFKISNAQSFFDSFSRLSNLLKLWIVQRSFALETTYATLAWRISNSPRSPRTWSPTAPRRCWSRLHHRAVAVPAAAAAQRMATTSSPASRACIWS